MDHGALIPFGKGVKVEAYRMRVLVALLVVGTALAEPETQPSWSPPVPAASAERVEEREAMVWNQIAHPTDGRTQVSDENVLKAMRAVPRHVFVPQRKRRHAYRDSPLSIGHGQTISQPYIVAMMTELLDLDENTRVLEIGTGSGYQAAVLAHLTSHVYTIEIVEPLAERARRTLAAQGYDSVGRHLDGRHLDRHSSCRRRHSVRSGDTPAFPQAPNGDHAGPSTGRGFRDEWDARRPRTAQVVGRTGHPVRTG